MEEKFLKITNEAYRLLEYFPESEPLKNRAKDKALAIMENLVLISGTEGWASLQKEKIKTQLSEDIDVLLGYFWIAKSQGWLSAVNCLIIANEYEKIRKDVKPVMELTGSGNPATQEFLGWELPHSGKLSQPDATSQKLPGMEDSLTLEENAQTAPESVLNNAGADGESTPNDNQNPPPHEVTARQEKILEFLGKNEKAQVMDLKEVLPDITKRTIRRDLDELLQAGKIARFGEFNQVFYKINGRPTSIN